MRLRYTLKFKLIVSVLLIMSVTYGISSFVIYHNVFGTMEEQIILDEQQKLEQTSPSAGVCAGVCGGCG